MGTVEGLAGKGEAAVAMDKVAEKLKGLRKGKIPLHAICIHGLTFC